MEAHAATTQLAAKTTMEVGDAVVLPMRIAVQIGNIVVRVIKFVQALDVSVLTLLGYPGKDSRAAHSQLHLSQNLLL